MFRQRRIGEEMMRWGFDFRYHFHLNTSTRRGTLDAINAILNSDRSVHRVSNIDYTQG